jgi:ribonuclease HII
MKHHPDPSKIPTLDYEQGLWKAGYLHIAGIDEAGRGAWAGPVCAAAVVLPPDPGLLRELHGVRDSKLMTPQAREAWAPLIRNAALAWGVGFASDQEIDALGILPATKLAATRALDFLTSPNLVASIHPVASPLSPFPFSPVLPDFLVTDYLIFPNLDLPQTALVKGDRLSLSVAAASVLAKTARDALMRGMEADFPGYGFGQHKGYGTALHRQAIHCLGLCPIHRRSFAIKDE